MKAKELTKEQLSVLFRTNAEKVRIDAGVTQEQFARSVGMSCSMYKRIVTGQRQVDAAYALLRLCAVYDVRIYDLFEICDDSYRIAHKYDKLSPDQKKHIEFLLDDLINPHE